MRFSSEIVSGAKISPEAELVVLLHGIRDHARWHQKVSWLLSEIDQVKVFSVKYGYFDVLKFLIPGPWRRTPIKKVLAELRQLRNRFPTNRISVIAHSYGTYAITQALLDDSTFKLHRLVLCGSIVPKGARWDSLSGQVNEHIINECGARDIWPVLAESVTWGFGATGTYGMESTAVTDRFHPFRHGDFFDDEFVINYWVPIFSKNIIEQGVCDKSVTVELCNTPRWWTLLLLLPVKWIIVPIAFSSLIWCSWRWSYAGPMKVHRIDDYSESQCIQGKGFRAFNEVWIDEYSFFGTLDRHTIQASVQKSAGLEVAVYDLLGTPLRKGCRSDEDCVAALPPDKRCQPEESCATDKYLWRKAILVNDGRSKVEWHWTQNPNHPNPEKAEGFGFKGHYPLTAFTYELILPDGVNFDGNWAVEPSRYGWPSNCERIYEEVGEQSKSSDLKLVCSGVWLLGLGPVGWIEDLVITFEVNGWGYCPQPSKQKLSN